MTFLTLANRLKTKEKKLWSKSLTLILRFNNQKKALLCICPPSVVDLLQFAEHFWLFPPTKENPIKVLGSVSKIRESRHIFSHFTKSKSIVSKSEITESQHLLCSWKLGVSERQTLFNKTSGGGKFLFLPVRCDENVLAIWHFLEYASTFSGVKSDKKLGLLSGFLNR